MKRNFRCIIAAMVILISSPSFTEQTTNKEEIVLTTYYPVPYGDYREMRAERMAVGQNWRSAVNVCWDQGKCSATVTPSETSLIVEGNVGIGTYDTGTARLAITGGNVGIGTNTPNNQPPAGDSTANLDVNDVYLRSVDIWASQIDKSSNELIYPENGVVYQNTSKRKLLVTMNTCSTPLYWNGVAGYISEQGTTIYDSWNGYSHLPIFAASDTGGGRSSASFIVPVGWYYQAVAGPYCGWVYAWEI